MMSAHRSSRVKATSENWECKTTTKDFYSFLLRIDGDCRLDGKERGPVIVEDSLHLINYLLRRVQLRIH